MKKKPFPAVPRRIPPRRGWPGRRSSCRRRTGRISVCAFPPGRRYKNGRVTANGPVWISTKFPPVRNCIVDSTDEIDFTNCRLRVYVPGYKSACKITSRYDRNFDFKRLSKQKKKTSHYDRIINHHGRSDPRQVEPKDKFKENKKNFVVSPLSTLANR